MDAEIERHMEEYQINLRIMGFEAEREELEQRRQQQQHGRS
jgi:hypothetical protein